MQCELDVQTNIATRSDNQLMACILQHMNCWQFHQLYGQLRQLNCKDILNRTDVDESLKLTKSLLHLTSSLQENDTINILTKVYRKCLELKKKESYF